MKQQPGKRAVFQLLRWGVPLAILSWLFYDVSRDNGFSQLRLQWSNWPLLLFSFGLVTTATVIGIGRWYLLVRALGLAFSPLNALRLGFLAELLNFVAIGSVGGDLFKAVFLARDYPGRRIHAVASVLVDRVVGFYSLFLLASTAILATNVWQTLTGEIRLVCRLTLLLTLIGTCTLIAVVLIDILAGSWIDRWSAIPLVGSSLRQVVEALRLYRRRWDALGLALMMSFGTHSLLAISVFFVASATTGSRPSLGSHLVIIPLATSTGILPLPFSGLGAFEYVVETLYQQMPSAGPVVSGRGLIAALGYRLISLGMAAVGTGLYLAAPREVGTALKQAAAVRENA